MLTRIFITAGVALACLGGVARAATVSVEDGVLVYAAEPGEANLVEVVSDPDVEGLVYVYEFEAQATPGVGCAPLPDPFAVTALEVYMTFHCAGVESVRLDLGDGDDYGGAYTAQPAEIDGADGRDDLWGGYADDVLRGGPGDDMIYGGPAKDVLEGGDGSDRLDGDYVEEGENGSVETKDGAADRLDGGAGDDVLTGGIGGDQIAGGDGVDVADYSARDEATVVTLDGQPGDGREGEGDVLGGDVEGAITGRGADRVTGDAGPNAIHTGEGDDTVDPGGGSDDVTAGDGKDALALRDGATDRADCGDGGDHGAADDGDELVDCDGVARPSGPGGPPVAAPARVVPERLTLKVSGRRGSRSLLKLRGTLTLPPTAPTAACAGGLVRVVAKVGRRRVRVDVPLDARCRFSAAVPVRIARRARIGATATFGGTAGIAPAKAKPVRTRAR